jgi:hypothetical protein
MSLAEVGARVRELTLDECAQALGIARLPEWLTRKLLWPVQPVAARLGRELEQFDRDVLGMPLGEAARAALGRFAVDLRVDAPELPEKGPLLVVANHPGAYDALSLFTAIGREDLAIVAAERAFLRALPSLAGKLIFVPDRSPEGRGASLTRSFGLRRALAHLRRGGALLQFGAGKIEPDPAFHSGPSCIADWQAGTGALSIATERAGGSVAVAIVSGVHSRRAKRSLVVRSAEARGITTLALLLQLGVPYYAAAEVSVRVRQVDALPREPGEATRRLEGVARELAAASFRPS